MSKSFVTLAQHVCPICGRPEDTGELLLDKRMRDRFEMHTPIGWGLCKEHQAKFDEGYIALVEIDEAKSKGMPTPKPEDVWRTGPIAHVRFAAADQIFNVPLTKTDGSRLPFIWVDGKVIKMLEEMVSGD